MLLTGPSLLLKPFETSNPIFDTHLYHTTPPPTLILASVHPQIVTEVVKGIHYDWQQELAAAATVWSSRLLSTAYSETKRTGY